MCRRKGFFVSLLILVTALFISVGARNAAATVVGGFHDLSSLNTGQVPSFNQGYQTQEICVFCHTPHASNNTQSYQQDPKGAIGAASTLHGQWLWNRALPSHNWLPYDSETFDANKTGHDANAGQPGTLSLMCLSCHDGIGAMNVLINYPNSALETPLGASGIVDPEAQFGSNGDANNFVNIGGAVCANPNSSACTGGNDLRNDHPIGFDYNADKNWDESGTGLKDITNAALLKRMVITKNRMECSTCHDPHLTNIPSTRASDGYLYNGNMFLVMSNTGSALCLQCHNK